jgi:GTPase SAR1 family protein
VDVCASYSSSQSNYSALINQSLPPSPSPQKSITSNYDLNFSRKVLVVGPSNVGKTTIISHMIDRRFASWYPWTKKAAARSTVTKISERIYEEEEYKTAMLNAKITLEIWDTPGSKSYVN